MIIKLKRNRKTFLKLFSISFSFILWLYVLSSAQVQIEKTIKINYVLPERLAIKNSVPLEVHYTLKGPRAFVRSIYDRVDMLDIDIKKRYIPGQFQYSFPIKSIGMSFPFGIEVVKVEPNKVAIELERKSNKIVPIVVSTFGEIPADHKLVESYIAPREVNISGPESLLKKITSFETFSVELNGLTGVGSKKLGIVQNDTRLQLPFSHVDYHYNIRPTRANLIIKDVPVRFLSSNMVISSDRRKVNLMVLADNGKIDKITKDNIKVIAEIPDNIQGNIEVELKAQLPKGVHLLEIQPTKIEVSVK